MSRRPAPRRLVRCSECPATIESSRERGQAAAGWGVAPDRCPACVHRRYLTWFRPGEVDEETGRVKRDLF